MKCVKNRGIKMSFSAVMFSRESVRTPDLLLFVLLRLTNVGCVTEVCLGNCYLIFLLLSAPGISLSHWTLDAPDTLSFNSPLTSAFPRLSRVTFSSMLRSTIANAVQ